MKTAVTLFGTPACHLCEQAEALLKGLLNPDFFQLNHVDIAERDELIARYGLRIPVLRRDADGQELNWPFDVEAVVAFLSEDDSGQAE